MARQLPIRMNIRIPLLFVLTLAGCGDDVRFETPQPEGRGDEDAFPKKVRGAYLNTKDSSVLTITADQITRKFNTRFVLPKSNLDSSLKIKGDTSFFDTVEKLNVVV